MCADQASCVCYTAGSPLPHTKTCGPSGREPLPGRGWARTLSGGRAGYGRSRGFGGHHERTTPRHPTGRLPAPFKAGKLGRFSIDPGVPSSPWRDIIVQDQQSDPRAPAIIHDVQRPPWKGTGDTDFRMNVLFHRAHARYDHCSMQLT